ncbi:uncharacterized protein LOC131147748 [Malania oleifera]|uniref:uncharacterized protein LOC131147748 n=1 Tax=Malania oleifera TaxID=397392 RepID=UPI0025AE8499|nr:uncharacterized protein LOC131147748 [Malania oleifera]
MGRLPDPNKEVAEEFVTYYKQLLGSEEACSLVDPQVIDRGPTLNEEQAKVMVEVVIGEEIKEALFSIGEDKSPGPDGYSSGFFKGAWEGDYRPMSCCNVVYKVIGKILAKRIKPCLGIVVNEAQSAFISKRNMIENIFLVQELVRKYGL